jgi:hypothetical protein
MTTWTYDRNHVAHFGTGYVVVPDQISYNQREHDEAGTIFPAYRCDGSGRRTSSRPAHVRLHGEAYGLHTTGTGDMIVRRANHPNRRATQFFAAYDDLSIYAVSRTAIGAVRKARRDAMDPTAQFRTAPISRDLAKQIERDGWNGNTNSFDVDRKTGFIIDTTRS